MTLPIEHAGDALRLLQDGLNTFVDFALSYVRRAVSPVPAEPSGSRAVANKANDEPRDETDAGKSLVGLGGPRRDRTGDLVIANRVLPAVRAAVP